MPKTKDTFTLDEIVKALNGACDEIAEVAQLSDSGTRDALNLLVNYAVTGLEHPDRDLETCVAMNYAGVGEEEVNLETVIDWIHE